MAIKDLQAKQGQVDLIAEVTEKGDIREFEKFGKKGKVCNAKIKDATGEMSLTLWNEQIDQIKTGQKIHIINGWVSEWQGEKQLSTGKFGQLEIVGEGDETTDEAEEAEIASGKAAKTDEGENILTEDEKAEEEIIKDEEEIK
ncbi:MAG: SOSS complex subunit B family protein [Nanoarchaeota archaeon]|nr:SOSS complex subunit B family protein [Nanoarchaeota archaeon]